MSGSELRFALNQQWHGFYGIDSILRNLRVTPARKFVLRAIVGTIQKFEVKDVVPFHHLLLYLAFPA